MKVAVSAVSGSLDSQIDPRFGRCQCFIIIDSDTMNFEAITNASQTAPTGAGIQAAQTIANKGAKVILTGNIGPNAHQAFSAAGIQMITGVSGTVREAVEKFKSGQLQQTTAAPTVQMGFGMVGSGMCMRRGMGGGRGMGYRRWQPTGPYMPPPTSPSLTAPTSIEITKDQEIQVLERQMNVLQQQLDQIKKKLEKLRE